jgi:hypothetical protein
MHKKITNIRIHSFLPLLLLSLNACDWIGKKEIKSYLSLRYDLHENIYLLESKWGKNKSDDSLLFNTLLYLYQQTNDTKKAVELIYKKPIYKLSNDQILNLVNYYTETKQLDSAYKFISILKTRKYDKQKLKALKKNLETKSSTKDSNAFPTIEELGKIPIITQELTIQKNSLDQIESENNYTEIESMIKNKEYELAIQKIDTLLTQDSTQSKLYLLKSKAQRELNDKVNAIKTLEKLLSMEPNNTDALANIGTLYMQRKRFKMAEKTFKKLEKLKPDTKDLDFKIAYALENQQLFEEAIKYYKKIDSTNVNYKFAQERINKLNNP